MALQYKYMEYDNAYHVVTEVVIKRRLVDNKIPEDSSRKSGLMTNANVEGREVDWKAGTIVTGVISIFKDKVSRDAGEDPIAYNNQDMSTKIMLDTSSEKDAIAQIYDFIKLSPLYEGAIDV